MNHILALSCLSISILISMSGCGGGNTVEYPENPSPRPSGPPTAVGHPAPDGEQPKQAAPES